MPGAATVLPALDDWKYWTKMNDWDSRNRLLEHLTDKMRRREDSQAEIQLLVVLCRPAWRAVVLSLRLYVRSRPRPRRRRRAPARGG